MNKENHSYYQELTNRFPDIDIDSLVANKLQLIKSEIIKINNELQSIITDVILEDEIIMIYYYCATVMRIDEIEKIPFNAQKTIVRILLYSDITIFDINDRDPISILRNKYVDFRNSKINISVEWSQFFDKNDLDVVISLFTEKTLPTEIGLYIINGD